MDCIIGYNEHGRYCIPAVSQHRPAAQTILSERVYEPDTVAFLCSFAGAVVHAGAYFGDFLPALARSRDALVYAFEPNPANYSCALITCLFNDLHNVRLMNAGLSYRRETLVMKTVDDDGRDLGGMGHFSEQGATAVQTVRLDDVIPGNEVIDVMHLDVERFESYALTGARKTIERCRPVLVVETLPELDWLDAMGYEMTGRLHSNYVLQCSKEVE